MEKAIQQTEETSGRRVGIITGASSGIGAEFARQLAAAGEVDELWFVARRTEPMRQLESEIGLPARIIPADLATDDGLNSLRTALADFSPRVTWLISAAGFGKFGRYDEIDEKDVIGMIDLNVKGAVSVTYMCLPYMEKGGHILEMGSASAFFPLKNFNIYASTKAFILHFGRALNEELKDRKISCTVFCPIWVDTGFFGVADKGGDNVRKPPLEKRKPLLQAKPAVARALRAAKKGKALYTTNWYTKLEHVLSKILPDPLLMSAWSGMQNKR